MTSTSMPRLQAKEGWGILVRVYGGISENRIFLVAAGVTFYLILALFPGIAALVSVYGLSLTPKPWSVTSTSWRQWRLPVPSMSCTRN
jgi:uncharacterized BrkB/YihY/UPF0761 family membrane protein